MSAVFHNLSKVFIIFMKSPSKGRFLICDTCSTDIRLQEHTESSLAKRTPAIKQLAKKYNMLVEEAAQKAASFHFAPTLVPEPLDLTKLFDVEANPHMWMADAVPTNPTKLPAYLCDDNVHRGIASLLVTDRVKEEVFRLQKEYQHLIKWVKDQISNLKSAIALCSGMSPLYLLSLILTD